VIFTFSTWHSQQHFSSAKDVYRKWHSRCFRLTPDIDRRRPSALSLCSSSFPVGRYSLSVSCLSGRQGSTEETA
jgi:hypothetical protein